MATKKVVKKKRTRGQAKSSPQAKQQRSTTAAKKKRATKRATTTKKKKAPTLKRQLESAQKEITEIQGLLAQKVGLGDLTAKRAAFVQEILVDNNATAAARRAGFSVKNASALASGLLRNVKVAAVLQKLRDARAERTNITADRILLELARIGLSDIRELAHWDRYGRLIVVPSDRLTDDEATTIAGFKSRTTVVEREDGSVETTTHLDFKRWDKVAALKEIGRHLGIEEKVAVTLRDPNSRLTRDQLLEKGESLIESIRSSEGKPS